MNDFEKAKRSAKLWSMDEENNIGEAVVTKMGDKYIVSADTSKEADILVKFVDGVEV